MDYMYSGQNKLIVPAGAVTDISGNPSDYFELSFDVEERLKEKIEVADSNPQDREKEVSIDIKEISFGFNHEALAKGKKFSNILLRTSAGKVVAFTPVLNDDKVTLSLGEDSMEHGTVYEIHIPSGVVQDRFFNENTEKTIRFRTEDTFEKPAITGTYPQNNQTGIDVNPSMEVYFSKPIKAEDCKLTLTDNLGREWYTTIRNIDDSNKGVLIIPIFPLYANYEYTLSGLYDSLENPSALEFALHFKTGKNALKIRDTLPNFHDKKTAHPINQPVEIGFSSAVNKGSAFDDIKLLNPQGYPVAFQAEIRGDKAILTPASDLEQANNYTVHIPGGAFLDEKGESSDTFRFKFTTAAKLNPDPDILNFPSIWFMNMPLTFDASIVEAAFKSEKYEIVSYEWDFGDRSRASGKNAFHTFNQAGDYHVVLNVKDNKGFSYEFSRTVTVEEELSYDLDIKVSRNGSNVLNITKGAPTLTYKARLEYEGQNVPGKIINVQLYKSGVLQRDYGTITSGSGDSAYVFSFTPSTLYQGTYELVFTYEGKNEVRAVREPVIIQGFDLTGPFRIRLLDNKTYSREPFEEADYLDIIINGVKKTAIKEWQSDVGYYAYVVKEEFNVGQAYTIQIKGWALDEERITVGGLIYAPKLVRGFVSRPGINNVTIESVEFKGRPAFVEGVDVGPATFKADGNWDVFEPGYYEFKTDSDRVSIKSSKPEFTFNPGKDFRGGERLMFRMVSKEGFRSPWYYASAWMFPRPSIGITKGLDISFVDGVYCLSAPAALNSVVGGTISLLDGVPLLSGGNFGFNNDIPRFIGEIAPNQYGSYEVNLSFSGEAGYGETKSTESKVKKLKKVVSAGYEVSAAIDGRLELNYDMSEKDWKLYYSLINMSANGKYTWTRGYKIPVIDVGIDTRLSMGLDIRTQLRIDKNDPNARVYSGIIRITPNATASIVFGADWVNVTGYLDAYIPADIHIPTGYIGVGLNVDTGIVGNFMLYSKTLYSKSLVSEHWDNGREKVTFMRTMKSTDEDEASDVNDSGLQPMPRNNLDRESVWMAGSQTRMRGLLRAAGSEGNPQTSVMMENIYPDADTELVQNGDELWLVWNDDNPERSDSNRTQLRYSIFRDGSWSSPQWFGQDETADFSPAMASTGNGMLLAWHNIKQAVSEEDGLGALIQNSEITVTESVYNSETGSPNLLTLTNDDKFDHSPRLAANRDNALLVWTKSEGLSFSLGSDTDEYLASKDSDSLYFSFWDGNTWSEPSEIEGALPVVLDSSLYVSGEEGLLLYVLDMDSDLSTQDDREVFAKIYNGGTWGEAVRLTDNQANDSGPRAVLINGEWFITWIQDGNVMYRNGLNQEIMTGESLQNVPADYELAVMNGPKPQIALVYKKVGEGGMNGLAAFFYDIENGVWGGDIALGETEGYTKDIAPVFTEDGKLKIAHTRAQIITEAIDGVEHKNISNKVDLCMLTYTPIHDIGFDGEYGLNLLQEIPFPDTVATAFVKVGNNGDFAENAAVDLYEGNPEAGGVLIGSTGVEKVIPARLSVPVGIEWLVGPEEKDAYDLYAVIRSHGANEINPEKKMLNLKILAADVAITDLKVKNVAWDDYLVEATLVNKGSKTLKEMNVQLEHVLSGQVLDTIPVQELRPGEETKVEFLISSGNLDKDENGSTVINLCIVVPENVRENSVENNIRQFELKPESIIVTATNPGQGDSKVGIHDATTLYFNMNVEKGTGFEQIALEDEDLNIIDTDKTLNGDMLTLTPLDDLKFNTRYTVTIPAKALGDSYGHTMDEDYSMSFTTTLGSPEVIFAYPGEGTDNIPLNADVRLQINQKAEKGPAFDDIAIYGPDQKKIPAKASINDEWIYIQPTGVLNRNTTYKLAAPRGSVINDKGEVQQEEYSFAFTTVNTADVPEDPGDSGSTPTNNQGDEPLSDYQYEGSLHLGNVNKKVAVIVEGEKATLDLGWLANELFSNNQNAVIEIPHIPNVNFYTFNFQGDILASSSKATLTINTAMGNIIIPANMLENTNNISGKTVGITMSFGDKSRLPAELQNATGNRPMIQLMLKVDGVRINWNNPQALVKVLLPYTPAAEELEKPEGILIWYIDENGNVSAIPDSWYRQSDSAVSFSTTHFSDFAVAYNQVEFNDVPTTAWYSTAVSFIANRGITTGAGNNNYSPDMKLTRGQFITMIMRAYGLEPDKNQADNFTDAGNTWYTGYLATAKRFGIARGVGNNMFAPEKEITRQEMFTLIYNILAALNQLPTPVDLTDENSIGSTQTHSSEDFDFLDKDEIDDWAREAVIILAKASVVKGSSGRIMPRSITTRAEMAQVIYNLITRQ
ncbi:MAG: Ig-like domain-containing protein [Peptostreptococcales bacterium]